MLPKLFTIVVLFFIAVGVNTYWNYAIVPQVNDEVAYNQLDFARPAQEQQNVLFWSAAKQYPGTIVWTTFAVLTSLVLLPEVWKLVGSSANAAGRATSEAAKSMDKAVDQAFKR